MIYFIENESGRVKIGHAKDPTRRLSSLQGGSHEKLTLVAVIADGGRPEESALHLRFADLRGRGEWFAPDARLRALMDQHRASTEGCRCSIPHERKFPAWMCRAGHNDASLAAAVGTDRSNISRIRRGVGRPSWDLAIQLCEFAGAEISIDDLVFPRPKAA